MIPELDLTQKTDVLLVRFGLHPVKDEAKSAAEGRPVFVDTEYIEIRVPGQRDIVHRPVRESDKHEFAQQYARFKMNAASGGEIGTPLTEAPFLVKSQVLELEHFGCRTVEQLAGMSDGALKNVGPIMELRTKARNYLQAASSNAPLSAMEAALKAKDAELETLKKQVAEIAAMQAKQSEKTTKAK